MCICLTYVEEIQFLLEAVTISFIKFARNYSYYNLMKELEGQIFNTIVSLRDSKKQPKEDTIYCIISKSETARSVN